MFDIFSEHDYFAKHMPSIYTFNSQLHTLSDLEDTLQLLMKILPLNVGILE